MMPSDMLNWMQQQQNFMLHPGVNISSSNCPNQVESFSKKRKTEKSNYEEKEKKMKQVATNEAENEKGEVLEESSKSKASKSEQKTDYIHVRARRGQATDSHSLAERVRREKISERMKYLQDLVPGCSNVTGKASVLDEIINYVQSLQKQIEFLSMKLAAAHPVLDCSINNYIENEVQINSSCSRSISIERSLELQNPSFELFDHLQLGAGASRNELDFMECGSSAWDYDAMLDVHKLDCLQGTESSVPLHLFRAEENNLM